MNITDIRTRIETSADEQSFLATQSEQGETQVLTLVDTAEQSHTGSEPDPLIQALLAKLPKPDAIWSIDDRAKWLKALAMIFNLVYSTEKGGATEQKIEKTELTSPLLSA